MQSGISASQELHKAFNELVSSPSQRGVIVGIKDERLEPLQIIPSTSPDFSEDLTQLASLLKENEAAYIILRRYPNTPDGFVIVTYVPDTANVRSKMLFASTRLTLARELGTERFRETLFATTKVELTAEGFTKHDAHGAQKAPLTEEEQTLQNVKAAEAEASLGTMARSSHIESGINFPISAEALDALRGLQGGSYNLVQLRIDVPRETIEYLGKSTIAPEGFADAVSDKEPRYSFFRYQYKVEGKEEVPIVFIYTCPTESKVKERMIYATSRLGITRIVEREAGLEVAKKIEASNPVEITASTIGEEFHPKKEEKVAFSRPKRPGKR
ncbi:MAG: Twinfilin-1 [Vezdaea acicularis]|nr:MAG: Twinfilin-1 [Vezdaea acicularis]